MSLKDLEKKLYNPRSHIERRIHAEDPFDPQTAKEVPAGEFRKEEEWLKPSRGMSLLQRKIFIAVVGLTATAVLAGVLGYFSLKYKRSAFSEEKVQFFLEGPKEIDSADQAELTLWIKNNNRAELRRVKVNLTYPENFRPQPENGLEIINSGNSRLEIGEIDSFGEKKIAIKGKFYAPRGHLIYLKGNLEYVPSNFNSVFSLQSQLGIKIISSPVSLEVLFPLEAADGNEVEYVFIYRNTSSVSFDDFWIKADYPAGFEFLSSQPDSSDNRRSWFIGSLGAGQEGRIVVRGIIRGSQAEGKIVRVYAGSSAAGSSENFTAYNEVEKITKLVVSPLSIRQWATGGEEGNIDLGEKINYTLVFRNNGKVGLRDVIVSFELDSRIFDFSRFRLPEGYFDFARKTITWKSADYPQLSNLAPGEEGSISFSVPVLSHLPINKPEDKNFTIKTVAKIDSPDVPTPLGSNKVIASNVLELKLNSRLVLESSYYYKNGKLENTGPWPLEIGQETTVAVVWKIINVSNDLAGAKVTAVIPTGLKLTDKIYPENENLFFNERTGNLTWEIGKIESATGILGPAKEIHFQLAFTPQPGFENKIVFFKNLELSAKDLFTGKQLTFNRSEFNITAR